MDVRRRALGASGDLECCVPARRLVDPGELLERARGFFAARDRGFALWVRAGEAADRELARAAEDLGLQAVYSMPEMVPGRQGGPSASR